MSTDKQIVRLNIGGTVFQTTKSTLTRCDGMFRVMMETEIPVIEDESSAIFIDRDPQHFRLILNFMRDGDVELPESEKDVKEVQKEAHYYLLTDLINLCDSKIPVKLKLTDEQLNLPLVYTDEDLLRVITKPANHVLIIYYATVLDGSLVYPRDLDITSLTQTYGKQIDFYLKSFKCDFEYSSCASWHWILYKKGCGEVIYPGGSGAFIDQLRSGIDNLLEPKSYF